MYKYFIFKHEIEDETYRLSRIPLSDIEENEIMDLSNVETEFCINITDKELIQLKKLPQEKIKEKLEQYFK